MNIDEFKVSDSVKKLNPHIYGDRTTRNRKRPELQKLENDRQETESDGQNGSVHNDGPEKEGVDGTGFGGYQVEIEVRSWDRRERDLDGCAATILDCLLDAIEGFSGLDKKNYRIWALREKRRRGLQNHDKGT